MTIAKPDDMLALARDNFSVYCVLVDPTYRLSKHIDFLIRCLHKVETHEWRRFQAWLPPGHSKTESCTRKFVPWYFGRNPTHEIILGCNTKQLANEFGNDIRNNLLNEVHCQIFPDPACRLSLDSTAKDNFHLAGGGKFFAAGVGTAIAGRRFSLGIIDDPIRDWEAAQSIIQRKAVHNWYKANFYSRQYPNAAIMVINTRWSENDLSGWLLDPHKEEEVEDWKILTMAAIAERDEGWRKAGEALWPEMFPLEELLKIKAQQGSFNWSSLYQQAPSSIEGLEIKRSWFRQYAWNPSMAADRNLLKNIITAPYQIIQSWDTALEPGLENDYSVCLTWMVTQSGYYLLDVYRKKVTAPELYQAARELAIYWMADCVLIEKSAAGFGLIQMMPSLTKVPVIGVQAKGDKKVRIRAASPMIEAGQVYVPYQAPWLSDYLNEMVAFPTGAHDDQVDATSQALTWIKNRQNQEEDSDYYERPQQSNISMFDV